MELKDLDNLRGEKTNSLMAILVGDDARVESGQTGGGRERERKDTNSNILYKLSQGNHTIFYETITILCIINLRTYFWWRVGQEVDLSNLCRDD